MLNEAIFISVAAGSALGMLSMWAVMRPKLKAARAAASRAGEVTEQFMTELSAAEAARKLAQGSVYAAAKAQVHAERQHDNARAYITMLENDNANLKAEIADSKASNEHMADQMEAARIYREKKSASVAQGNRTKKLRRLAAAAEAAKPTSITNGKATA